MKSRLVPRMLTVLLAGVIGLAGVVPAASAPPDEQARPITTPMVAEWEAGSQPFTFTDRSRVVVDERFPQLRGDAETFADDLAALTGTRPDVVVTKPNKARAGDILLALDARDDELGTEGYRLTVHRSVTISGNHATGTFRGTRTVLQLLEQSTTISGGVVRDWPQYAERGIRIDTVPRKYSSDWWQNLIRELSYLRMSQLQVLLIGGNGLSEAEIEDIVAFAGKYHIEVIPTVALPAHSDPIVVENEEYRLLPNPVTGVSFDFTKPGALDVARTYIERYIDMFPGQYWHTGGDEFLTYPYWTDAGWSAYPQLAEFARAQTGDPDATAADGYVWFLNWVNSVVKEHGKTLRIWNDYIENDTTVELDADIVVEHWIDARRPNSATPDQIAENHQILNVAEEFLYHDMGLRSPDPRRIYEEFDPTVFNMGLTVSPEHADNVSGAMIAVWMWAGGGRPYETSGEMFEMLRLPLRSLAQVTWGSPSTASYEEFAAVAPNHAPGFVATEN